MGADPGRRSSAFPGPTGLRRRSRQTEYGIDRARYRVSTDRPLLLVENEIHFPGWTPRLEGASQDAVRVNDALRGWRLPAGSYELETVFRLAHLRPIALTSAAAWVAWVIVLVAARRRRERR